MRLQITKFLCLAVIAVSLAACGVKSQPVAPAGANYPAHYPTPLPPLGPQTQKPGDTGPLAPAVSDPNSFWQYPNTPPAQ